MRDVISTEMWEALNSFYLVLGRYDLRAALQTGPYSFYQDVKERCALFWGVVDRTLLRDEGRSFLEAGGHIEQADMVLRMLRVAIPAGALEDGHEGEALALLHAVGGAQAYRRAVARPRRSDRWSASCSTTRLSRLGRGVGRGARGGADDRRRAAALLAAGAAARAAGRRSRAPAPAATRSRLEAQAGPGTGRAELVDHDVDDRYFAIAALSAVLL